MSDWLRLCRLLQLIHAWDIARRYLVTNGFYGALMMLGLLTGFRIGGTTDLKIIINACLGAAVALGVSGLSSAYISEAVERRRELKELEKSLITDLSASEYGRAARLVPVMVALVNGLSPFVLSLIIMGPLWLALWQPDWLWLYSPVEVAIVVALAAIFTLGAFLGRISGTSWLWAGVRAVMLALVTAGLVLLLEIRG